MSELSETRKISIEFMNNLTNGTLQPLLTRVKEDQTLMLEIRKNYINIYYRGGNILEVTECGEGDDIFYQSSFDKEYNKSGQNIPSLPKTIRNQTEAQKWVDALPDLKKIMDKYFSRNEKTGKNRAEREFQQLVARENNLSSISNETEYFVTDIEYTEPGSPKRFDILALQWPADQRQDNSKCKAALIEMKYGDKALGEKTLADKKHREKPGLIKHLKDMGDFINDQKRYGQLLLTMKSQFNQLDELGLLKFKRSKSCKKESLDIVDKPEVIFLLANHNPRSKKLEKILNSDNFIKFVHSDIFDLRFYVSNFAGYGLHKDSMRNLAEFRDLCKVKKNI